MKCKKIDRIVNIGTESFDSGLAEFYVFFFSLCTPFTRFKFISTINDEIKIVYKNNA